MEAVFVSLILHFLLLFLLEVIHFLSYSAISFLHLRLLIYISMNKHIIHTFCILLTSILFPLQFYLSPNWWSNFCSDIFLTSHSFWSRTIEYNDEEANIPWRKNWKKNQQTCRVWAVIHKRPLFRFCRLNLHRFCLVQPVSICPELSGESLISESWERKFLETTVRDYNDLPSLSLFVSLLFLSDSDDQTC